MSDHGLTCMNLTSPAVLLREGYDVRGGVLQEIHDTVESSPQVALGRVEAFVHRSSSRGLDEAVEGQ